jgi:hypothetical protein
MVSDPIGPSWRTSKGCKSTVEADLRPVFRIIAVEIDVTIGTAMSPKFE